MRKENHISSADVQGKQTGTDNKPSLPRHLFWDQRYDDIDWTNGYRSIIARVIERGNQEDWEEMLHFYGRPKVVNALKNEIKYLPDYAIEDVCSYFNLRKEQLLCYNRKQLRKGHWI
ncbi:MAG: hypothetical protein J0H29_09730 [Sphingobacteriales bacterium]|nr:hypothetical protein [Sphingobacteriales bacterium]